MRRLVFALLVCGCAPSSEILLHVDTDALVPPAIPDDTRPPWLFDRVRLEVLRGGQPIDPPAARDFALTEDLFRAGQVSIGIAATPGESDLSARVRLYRSGRIVAGEPRRSSTLDTTVTLPSVGTSDRVDVTVRLHTDDVGLPKGPIAPDAGLPGPSQVSTWPGAAIVPCHGQPGPDEVCVPGGAYWMGDPLLGNLGDGLDADQERLVVLSPFFLDAREVTVADYRAVAAALNEDKPPEHPDPGNSTSDLLTWCTWSTSPLDRELLPLNCTLHSTAVNYCGFKHKLVPTEAQLEFAASGRGRELGYVWGSDDPTCADAVFGRGGVGPFISIDPECLPNGSIGLPLPPGSTARDRVRLPGASQDVVDLAGNMAEWARDKWSRQDEAFWSQGGVFHDPVANVDSPADGGDLGTYATKGGYFQSLPLELRAGFR
ncbi:MAG TPA: SUMF1/EgtB/PvdO family nonheme iron enzyme, partial [Polyangia bacterium]|nr:SUMF1/EgtB/PvdO family nonheme iron enzyme [Polyangia bacterium]